MANCPNCGAPIAENEAFCGSCGHKIEKVEPQVEQPVEQPAETGSANAATEMLEKGKEVANGVIEKVKSGDKKMLGIIACAAAAVVLVVVLLAVLLSGNKMDPINKYVKALNRNESDYLKLTAITRGKYGDMNADVTRMFIEYDAEYWDGETYGDLYEDRDDNLKDFYDEIEDEYGKFKVSFKKSKIKKIKLADFEDDYDFEWEDYTDDAEDAADELKDMLKDSDEIEDFADEYEISEKEAKKILNAQMDFYKKLSKSKLTNIYEIKGKFIVKADGDEYKSETVSLFVGKVSGEWVLLGCDGSIYFEDDEEGMLEDLFSWFYEFL